MLLLQQFDLLFFDFSHARVKFVQSLHLVEVGMTLNFGFLFWSDSLKLHRLRADRLVELRFQLLQLAVLVLNLLLQIIELSLDRANEGVDSLK